ncbi:MAG: hypothetical protein OQJ99_02845 [Rhodospirillales bacterium]|nr:hypothetical protein [Rhodospirillales bacterium]MCW8860874.1 hypothetical protein [Rhodospirillales bacterium]MCW8952547.1 hypothetical protein [Rhodospirillales bacterium]MCW8970298.1 hypothetical protein [Rhodospirillales bacterium]MCW9003028.1 hypothetical protein [Rhodospirillales bacterium]
MSGTVSGTASNMANDMATDTINGKTSRDGTGTDSGTQGWRRHPIDLRFSLPFFGTRFYLTVVGGREQRTPERISVERKKYPLRTVANLFFFLGIATIFYTTALIAMAVHSAIIEF